MSSVEALRHARTAGVRVTLKGDRLGMKSNGRPPTEILDALAAHKAAILDLLRNPPCRQCGEADGLQELVDGVWLHQECAAYRRQREIPWNATPAELVRLVEAEVTVAAANARLDANIRQMGFLEVWTAGVQDWLHRECIDLWRPARRCALKTGETKMDDLMTVDQWLAIRKEAALQIDPETAEVDWVYARVGDPYRIGLVPDEECTIGREYFARAPGSDVWVWFGDLPEATSDALWEKHKSKLAFPAGLSFIAGPA
jgi:hypothetical protein